VTGSQRLTQIAGQAAELFTLRYSRKQEYQSDDFGIRYMREAGYDPFAAADMLDALARQERYVQATRSRDEARSIPEWARTHPLTENRIERARETAAATGTAPDALPENEVRYLTMLDGLLYGDDPQQGFVQGRRFVHPVMRIGFEAPEGFTLTNSPQAILIEGPDGLRGEFGGGSLPRGGLEAYVSALLQQMLGDAQAQAGEAQQTIVNGVRALFVPIVVQTQQGPMELSIAAYAGGGTNAFHFIMISPPAKGSTAAISALFRSFRLLSPADVAALKPRQIRVVKAGPSDTARSLSAKMVSDNSFEHFLMLNGRSAEQPLRAGELVKLVQLAAQ
jgi:predicted Zn-dependent protease